MISFTSLFLIARVSAGPAQAEEDRRTSMTSQTHRERPFGRLPRSAGDGRFCPFSEVGEGPLPSNVIGRNGSSPYLQSVSERPLGSVFADVAGEQSRMTVLTEF